MKDSTVKTIRTACQSLFIVAASMPAMLPALGVATASGVGATLLAVSAGVARLHAVPAINELLNKYLGIPK